MRIYMYWVTNMSSTFHHKLLITNITIPDFLPSFRPCSLDRDPSSIVVPAARVHAWQLSRILLKKNSIDAAMAKPLQWFT